MTDGRPAFGAQVMALLSMWGATPCLLRVRFALVGADSCSGGTGTGAAVPAGAETSPAIMGACLSFNGLCRTLAGENEPDPCAGGCSGALTCKHVCTVEAAELCRQSRITVADDRVSGMDRRAGEGRRRSSPARGPPSQEDSSPRRCACAPIPAPACCASRWARARATHDRLGLGHAAAR